jgi:D-alanyl-D-alanine carboxypeptidase
VATAFPRSYPGGIIPFVEAVNCKDRELGMTGKAFVDSSGSSRTAFRSGRLGVAIPVYYSNGRCREL